MKRTLEECVSKLRSLAHGCSLDWYLVDDLEEGINRVYNARDLAWSENEKLREALTKIYQSGKGRHVDIAREALNS